MVQSWGAAKDPDLIGSGLIVPGVAAAFAGAIGGTKVLYLYGVVTNPDVAAIIRTRELLRLMEQLLGTARAAGYTWIMGSTSNPTVVHYFKTKLHAAQSGDVLFEGRL